MAAYRPQASSSKGSKSEAYFCEYNSLDYGQGDTKWRGKDDVSPPTPESGNWHFEYLEVNMGPHGDDPADSYVDWWQIDKANLYSNSVYKCQIGSWPRFDTKFGYAHTHTPCGYQSVTANADDHIVLVDLTYYFDNPCYTTYMGVQQCAADVQTGSYVRVQCSHEALQAPGT